MGRTDAPAGPVRERILGLPVDAVTMDGAVALAADAIRDGRRFRVAVTNAHKSWLARRDPRLRGILEESDLVVPEWATAWAAGVLGRPGIQHVGGITLMGRLLEEAADRGWSAYFLGARTEVVEALVERFGRERPSLRVAGYHHGYLTGEDRGRVRAELGEKRPDLLFVAMGSPLQEYWIAGLPAGGGARVCMGVGGSFDVLAGFKRDAPVWARGRGLEWLYRLAQDPRRLWRRYLVTNAWFVGAVVRERVGLGAAGLLRRWVSAPGASRRRVSARDRSGRPCEPPPNHPQRYAPSGRPTACAAPSRGGADSAAPSRGGADSAAPSRGGAASAAPSRGEAVGSGRAGSRWLAAALDLDVWMQERDYAGYDPHDLLNSRVVRALSFGNRWLAVAWTQLGRRSPVNLRPLLGVRRVRNAKGVGLALAAHARLAEVTGEVRFRESAAGFVHWLGANRSPAGSGGGWGYPFPWANRDFYAPADTPSSVATAFIGHALLDAAERLGLDGAVGLAEGAGEFLRRDLNRLPGPDGTFCFSYTPLDRRAVHNANLLAASLLARLAERAGDAAGAEVALRAARFTAAAQRPDGSWPYGTTPRNAWVDSFHTSYNLVALRRVGRHLATAEFDDAITRGLDFWRDAFLSGPAVGLRPGSAYPVDTHAVAHAIVMLLALEDRMPGARVEAAHLADWAAQCMRDPDGFFYYRKHRFWRNRTAYMRWTQAWMLRALAELAAAAPTHPASER